ncbi:hypothetical protein [Nonomuraea diastatica]|uniref:Uncharacterized protein n=1 Tax=Nonomuraea diastatica TaxID=1848329 RepID=A0A4R4VGC6_9ACTN|nr:hypothetical protein [Nonomuraea diastatica]TDD03961.1 hypothetical protein E1294_50405 [Nonomuraea diastatica]
MASRSLSPSGRALCPPGGEEDSVPGLYAGIAGPGHAPPGPLSILLVLTTGAAGVMGTLAWWRNADHDR